MVMTAHTFNTVLDPDYPATLSRATIDGILRKQLGFDGVVVSDDLYMGAIVQHYSYETAVEKAINAGVDLLVVANDKAYRPDIMPIPSICWWNWCSRAAYPVSGLIRPAAGFFGSNGSWPEQLPTVARNVVGCGWQLPVPGSMKARNTRQLCFGAAVASKHCSRHHHQKRKGVYR